ncbi:MAG TPA: EamA family transporter RarD [Gemmatales bacterium]|nr:EamA family transporter RarD [Gemmatales bacterium]
MTTHFRQGLFYGLAAYGLWGAIPIYFKLLGKFANSYEILAHRIVWSALLLVVVLTLLRGQWARVRAAFAVPRSALALVVSSILIAANWFVYIYGVETERIMQCSLGYFVTPLVNVALGVFLLGERFRPWQGVALGCGAIGMLVLASMSDSFPWIAISLAITFSSYGLMRKLASIETLIGLTAESLLLTPIALWYLFSTSNVWQNTDASGQWMLILSGPATVIPLFCFGQAARLLPLSTLGFLQYLSPSLQFLVAVLLFLEPMSLIKAIAFGAVWLGLLIFTWDILRRQQEQKRSLKSLETESLRRLGKMESVQKR